MTVWFRISDTRQLPGIVLRENVWDMGFYEIESLENGKKYLVMKNEITKIVK